MIGPKFVAATALLLCSLVRTSRAVSYSFTNIADTTTPGPSGTLEGFGLPSVSDGVVAFGTHFSGLNAGVLTGQGAP